MSPLRLVVALAVAAAMVLACGDKSSTPTPNSVATSTTPGGSAGDLKVSTITVADDTPRYTINVKYPQLGLAGDARIKQIVDSTVDDVKKATQSAPQPQTGKYTVDGTFDSTLSGDDIVAVQLSISAYTGGAHGAHRIYAFNFDRRSGKELTLEVALSLIGMSLQQLADQTATQLKTKLTSAFFAEGATADRKNYETFLISADKVTFIFQEYQVAPYAAGPQEVAFPRSILNR